MFNVLVTSRMFGKLNPEPIKLLFDKGFDILDNPFHGKTHSENELLGLVQKADAAICGDDYFSKRVIKKAKNLKILSKYGVGVDRINIEAATKQGIVIANAPGSNKHAVADLAFTLMLSVARKLREAENVVQNGGWRVVIGRELYNKTLGIIGFGEIGREVAKRAKGFNVKIVVYDPYVEATVVKDMGVELVGIDKLLSQSDFVSLHLPSLPATKKFIDKHKLSLMKETAYLINTARGDIVDEEALLDALLDKKISGAALDTLAIEPPINNNLNELNNVIVTPHIGAHTYEANYIMGMMAAQNVVDVLEGRKPKYIVNQEVYKYENMG
ncbi:hydroxyacid dehydrogenase [Salibacterium salarium]|uniref:Hydroxyacid dehydrogenase n=1 Tax=Salibacterium salarium TaxID=284579 RepID=A0A428N5U2_9BACI|nr:phosphoglycerate dehydrogenase [Salibacterium salarium]RSL33607.1 hydroxyacid dehydrogenase [Salibacterium salarium]